MNELKNVQENTFEEDLEREIDWLNGNAKVKHLLENAGALPHSDPCQNMILQYIAEYGAEVIHGACEPDEISEGLNFSMVADLLVDLSLYVENHTDFDKAK